MEEFFMNNFTYHVYTDVRFGKDQINVLPELINCIASFIRMVPAAVEWIVEIVGEDQLMSYFPFLQGEMDMTSISSQIESLLKTMINGFGGAVGSIVSALTNFFSLVVSIVIGLIFSIYVLIDKEKLSVQCKQMITTYMPKKANKIFYFVQVLNESFHSFIVGQVTEAVVLGVLCIIGMMILRFPYAVMIGVFIGFTALIPIAGAYIGAVVGAIMMLSVDPFLAIEFIIFILILQQIEGNLIYPRVVGQSIGLPGIWVLTAVTVGGGILGVGGMLLAVPLFAAGYRLLREDITRRNSAAESKSKVESKPEVATKPVAESVEVKNEQKKDDKK